MSGLYCQPLKCQDHNHVSFEVTESHDALQKKYARRLNQVYVKQKISNDTRYILVTVYFCESILINRVSYQVNLLFNEIIREIRFKQ